MTDRSLRRVLLTGATGFVGRHLYPALIRAGYEVICATRRPGAARGREPGRRWVALDVSSPRSVRDALHGCDAAIYLVHAMSGRGDYEAQERRAAHLFARAAEERRLLRIVYLGGVAPAGRPSKHLRSRLATGEILRAGTVPAVELRASMIIGPGSESWTMVRDLCVRLPVMVLPRWLETRTQPIAIRDVVFALVAALALPREQCGCYALPGPEVLTAVEIQRRTARLVGNAPRTYSLPVLPARLSSYWIQFITRADGRLARELVEGLRSDLVARDDGFWKLFPEHARLEFDAATRWALREDARRMSLRGRLVEHVLRQLSRRESE